MSYSCKADNRLKHGARALKLLAADIPLSIPETAAVTNYSPFAIFMKVQRGDVEAHRRNDGQYLIPADAVRSIIGPKLESTH